MDAAWVALRLVLDPGARVEVRPPPGLARGLFSVPGWVALVVTGLALSATLGLLLWRSRRERRR